MENNERAFDGAPEGSDSEESSDQENDAQDLFDSAISDEEEDELASFVERVSGGRLDFPGFHGMMTAFAIGPIAYSPSEIVQVLIRESKEERPFSKGIPSMDENVELIARLQREILFDLDGELYEPESFEREHPSGETYPDTFSWCEGFILGINQDGELWQKWYEDSRRKMALSPIEAAASREFRSSGVYFETAEKMWVLYDMIERVVPLIRCFWHLELGLDEMVGDRALP